MLPRVTDRTARRGGYSYLARVNLARFLRRTRIASSLPRYYGIAATRYGFHPLSAARSLATALQERYVPDEAFDLGLLRPGADAGKSPEFLSKSRFVEIQRRMNLGSWEFVLSDKGVFARFAQAAGLPTPPLLALYFPGGAGWCGEGTLPASRDDWRCFLETKTPAEFVVKTTRGAYGRSVQLYTRRGTVFTDFEGRTFSAGDLLALFDRARSSFLLQERARNHPDLLALSGAEGLQTVRITSFVARDSSVRMLYAFFKPIVGGNAVDNFRHATTGNLLAGVSLDNGTLGSGITYADGGGAREVAVHPLTGVPFEGFKLPWWEEACALVRRAAAVFLPVRMIGWDVGLTPEGPVLIEGNFWPDPPTLTCPLDRIVGILQE